MPENNEPEHQPLDAFQPLREAPPEVRRIIEQVLRLEQERLYQRAPRLNDDVLRVIKEAVT
jgi:hypothetical protein